MRNNRPDLDRPPAYRWNARRQGDGLVQIFGFDQVVAAQCLLGFGQGTIALQVLPITYPYRGRFGCRLQLVSPFVMAALSNVLGKLHVLLRYRVAFLLTHICPLGFLTVYKQQIFHGSGGLLLPHINSVKLAKRGEPNASVHGSASRWRGRAARLWLQSP